MGNWPFASAQPAGNANNRLFYGGKFLPWSDTDRELRTNNSQLTAGQRLYQQLGLTGARGEAEAGYPLVINHALPHYLTLLDQGLDPELALLDTLLLLWRSTAIPTLLRAVARGACAGYSARRKHYRKKGASNPADLDYLRQFDRECIKRNLSQEAVPTC